MTADPTNTARGNTAQAEYWDELTESWLAAEVHSGVVAGPFGELALAGLAPVPGERILDIGCGSGPTTLAIAAAVAPGGSAVGVDIAPGMIQVARSAAAAAGVAATFEVADAQTADLGGLAADALPGGRLDALPGGRLDAPFDAAFSRFGVMFFADPVAAFANIASSLVDGGRLAFACWQDLFQNEWMLVPGAAAIGVTGEFPPMPGPGEPGPFSLADPTTIERVLTDAGLADIRIEPVATTLSLPTHAVASMTALSQHVGPVREALRTADDALAQRIVDAVTAALQDKVVDGELRLTAAANIVTARVWRT